MDEQKRASKPKKPRLRREDIHRHPQQGTQPYQGPPSRHHPDESAPWHPYAAIPTIMHARGVGTSGFTTGDMRVPGPFSGVGPRNYAKTDPHVLEDVCELLTRHGELDVRNVDVHCRNGVIRIEGHVPTRWMRREVEAAADSIGGVVDIQNDLSIEDPS